MQVSSFNKPLPTLFYPYYDRANWRYWYKLRNGEYIIRDYQTITQCARMLAHCRKLGIEFKACPRNSFGFGMDFAFLLNLFYNRLSDRKPTSPENIEKLKNE